ncbi:helix-turn-helix domain-containing protein [Mesorhizobium sp. BAC0120]|uniref:winged helix-turn-helix transcriptional regulator n=1 Tax=Mesorhizobium sp. BAC0120 TaxID=3090670 RepID=UPI00298C368F|nr:helix-turn-helix domain-containing protein [Mesorhizobium sp. BAC0120]MDW6020632.1 helix-turn-helix domain-containing protein [Mesorhizobium sp. BAC0120]
MVLSRRKSKVPPLPACPPQPCPLQQCMELLGGAWTPNIVWNLSGDPRRFSELRSDIPNISAKVLSARLRALADKGVITRSVIDTSPPTVEYALTALGRELLPVIDAIERVGRKLAARAG